MGTYPVFAHARGEYQHGEYFAPLGFRQMMMRAAAQHHGVAHLQFGYVVVWKHTRMSQELNRCGTANMVLYNQESVRSTKAGIATI